MVPRTVTSRKEGRRRSRAADKECSHPSRISGRAPLKHSRGRDARVGTWRRALDPRARAPRRTAHGQRAGSPGAGHRQVAATCQRERATSVAEDACHVADGAGHGDIRHGVYPRSIAAPGADAHVPSCGTEQRCEARVQREHCCRRRQRGSECQSGRGRTVGHCDRDGRRRRIVSASNISQRRRGGECARDLCCPPPVVGAGYIPVGACRIVVDPEAVRFVVSRCGVRCEAVGVRDEDGEDIAAPADCVRDGDGGCDGKGLRNIREDGAPEDRCTDAHVRQHSGGLRLLGADRASAWAQAVQQPPVHALCDHGKGADTLGLRARVVEGSVRRAGRERCRGQAGPAARARSGGAR